MGSQNALAYTRLQPLKNTDTGSLVENHIRFWEQYEDKREAQKKALELKQAEYNRKLLADNAKGLPKIKDAGKSALYLGDTWLQMYRNNLVPAYLDAQKRAKYGDESAKLKLYQINNTIDEMNRTNDVWTEKSKYFANKDNTKLFNPLYDKDALEFFKAISTAQYHPTSIYDKLKIHYNGKVEEYSIPELNQKINSLQFTGTWTPEDYAKIGKSLSERVKVKDDNGNIILGKYDKQKVNSLVDEMFANERFAKTYAYYLGSETGQNLDGFKDISVNKALTPSQLKMAKSLWKEKYMGIQEKDNSYANALKLERLKSSRDTRKRKMKTINVSTDNLGNFLKTYEVTEGGRPIKTDEKSIVYHISGREGDETPWVQDPKEKNGKIVGVVRNKDGEMFGIGYKDKITYDKKGKKTGQTRIAYPIYDTERLNFIATQMSEDGTKEKSFKNYEEMQKYAGKLVGEEDTLTDDSAKQALGAKYKK